MLLEMRVTPTAVRNRDRQDCFPRNSPLRPEKMAAKGPTKIPSLWDFSGICLRFAEGNCGNGKK